MRKRSIEEISNKNYFESSVFYEFMQNNSLKNNPDSSFSIILSPSITITSENSTHVLDSMNSEYVLEFENLLPNNPYFICLKATFFKRNNMAAYHVKKLTEEIISPSPVNKNFIILEQLKEFFNFTVEDLQKEEWKVSVHVLENVTHKTSFRFILENSSFSSSKWKDFMDTLKMKFNIQILNWIIKPQIISDILTVKYDTESKKRLPPEMKKFFEISFIFI